MEWTDLTHAVIGFGLTAWSMYDMTGWTTDVSQWTIMRVGFLQGAGLGFLFVPLTVVAFATLPASARGDGAGLFNLSRNIGSSVGIAIFTSLITQNVQRNHAEIVGYVTPFNRVFDQPNVHNYLNPLTAAGRAALDNAITFQAMVISYLDDFKLLMLLSLAAMPLVLLLKAPKASAASNHSVALD